MKSFLFICLATVALAAPSGAQQQANQPTPTKAARAPADPLVPQVPATRLHLSAGPLPDVVGEIVNAVPRMNEEAKAQWTTPNVVYEEAARHLRVPADLRLHDVTPVQAVALAAAAAGCTVEPILAPQEGAPGSATAGASKATVIGYRIVAGGPPARSDEVTGIGISLMSKEGTMMVGEVYPNTPAARSGKIKPGDRIVSVAEHGSEPATIEGQPIEKVAELIRGPAGSMVELGVRSDDRSNPTIILLSREKMDFDRTNPAPTTTVRAVDPASKQTAKVAQAGERQGGQITGGWANTFSPLSATANTYSKFSRASSPDEPIVRVYAVGSLLSGTPQESAEKQDAFRELVAAALQDDGSRKTNPSLNFHSRSKALIVKGTPAEHALIQQILGILQENEKAEKPRPAGL